MMIWLLVFCCGQESRALTNDGAWKGHLQWWPDGSQLLYSRIKTGKLEVAVISSKGGQSRPLIKPHPGTPHFDAHPAPNGSRIAYVHDILQGTDGKLNIYACKADGTAAEPLIPHKAFEESPRWSPDGKTIAWVSTRDGNQELYVSLPDGSDIRRLTNHPAPDHHPAWSPDGRFLAFTSARSGTEAVHTLEVATGTLRKLAGGKGLESWPAWSRDGKRIAFARHQHGSFDIVGIRPDGTGEHLLVGGPDHATFPAFSPDGTTLACISDRTGAPEVHLFNLSP
jgi:TolB protein